MEILIVAAELSPVTPSSEVGDAVAGLSRALSQQGHSITVALPKPEDLEASGLMFARRLTPVAVADGSVSVYDGRLTSGVAVVLLESTGLDPQLGASTNGAQQAIALSNAVAALVSQRATSSKPFEVVHAHGLAGAPLPLTGLALPSVLTIYELEQLGNVSGGMFDASGLELPSIIRQKLTTSTGLSLLRAGMFAADVVVTASAQLADQLRAESETAEEPSSSVEPTQRVGLGSEQNDGAPLQFAAEVAASDTVSEGSLLEPAVLQSSTAGETANIATPDIAGRTYYSVVGGIDYATYNPATDSALPSRFDAEGAWGKGHCKSAMCKELELGQEPEVPLLVYIGRLSAQSGADTVLRLLPELLKLPIQFVVAGSGSEALVQQFGDAKWKLAQNYRFVDTLNAGELRRVLAAADLALCPQSGANGGQSVRIAQRLGAVPVAFAVPGSADAVVSCDPELDSGTGFLASGLEAENLLGAVQSALAACGRPAWGRLRRRVMRQDLSWERPARRYAQLYKVAATA